jgi:hypothetical protein
VVVTVVPEDEFSEFTFTLLLEPEVEGIPSAQYASTKPLFKTDSSCGPPFCPIDKLPLLEW